MGKINTSKHQPFTAPFSLIISMTTVNLIYKDHYTLAILFFIISLFIVVSAVIDSRFKISDIINFKKHYIWFISTLLSISFISFSKSSMMMLGLDFIMALVSLIIGSIIYLIDKK